MFESINCTLNKFSIQFNQNVVTKMSSICKDEMSSKSMTSIFKAIALNLNSNSGLVDDSEFPFSNTVD